MQTLSKVISGGQTGVDQAALRAARDCGLEIGGWCPPGQECENGVIPAEFPLKETPHDPGPDAPDLPRSESKSPGIGERVYALLRGVFDMRRANARARR